MGSLALLLPRSGRPDPASAQRMLEAAPHRGTLREVVLHGSCLLGVSSPVDAPNGASLAVADGMAAAFVGSLDNAADLATKLGLSQNEAGPVEAARVVVAAFDRFGAGAPQRLRGTYAAAVTDGKRAWCLRDHLGFGQLFYRQDAQGFFAATEAKQVVAGSGIASEPDLDVVEAFFYGDMDETTPAALKGVDRLPHASLLTTDGGSTRWRRYWDPEPLLESACLAGSELRERFDELMTQAVARTLGGNDVVSLSGGIDSPAIAAYGAPLHLARAGRPLGALTWVFPDHPKVDEREYAEIVARDLGLHLQTFKPQLGLLDDIDEWCRLCDGPNAILPPAQVAERYRNARQLGYTTLLTGEDAEMVFDFSHYLLPHLAARGRLRALSRHVRHHRSTGTTWRYIGRQLALAAVPRPVAALYERHRDTSGGVPVPAWLEPDPVKRVDARYARSGWDRWRCIQLAFRKSPRLALQADDVCQAVSGIKARRPWSDVDLLEFFLSLPAEVKFPRPIRKALVRDLLRGRVPGPILDRNDKTYFNDYFMSNIDYQALTRLLVRPRHRLHGVRYEALEELIERRTFDMLNYKLAVDLAKCHAFLNLW